MPTSASMEHSKAFPMGPLLPQMASLELQEKPLSPIQP